jgi:hypothetical protein
MRGSFKDLPVDTDMPQLKLRHAEWGAMTVELGEIAQTIDVAPLFKGLPHDRCQCPHWGYVIKGTLRYRFADHEEVYRAGDSYYAAPGLTPFLEAGTAYVEFSPTKELEKTTEVANKNAAALMSGQ